MKKTITLFFIFFLAQFSYAAHLVGGEITYTCVGNNQYQVKLRIYRDCFSGGAQFDNTVNFSVYNLAGTLVTNPTVSKGPTVSVPAGTGNPCLTTPPNICTEYADYVTTLTLPPVVGGYTISYQRCCRNSTITNITNPGSRGNTYTVQIPSMDNSCNTAPAFTTVPPIVLCLGDQLSIDASATEADGDSLFYEFCDIYTGGASGNPTPNPATPPPYTLIQFVAPATATQPVPGNPALAINSQTGMITGIATTAGQYVVGICVSEYRNGQLLSVVRRDYQFNLTNCSGPAFSNPQNFTAYLGTGWANFKCKSTYNAATYQWQLSTGAGWIDLLNLGHYTGVTSDSLVITGVTSAMNNYGYRCIVESCTTDTSDIAFLTVVNGIGLGESTLDKLTISPNPTNGLVSLNTSVVGTYELLTLDGRVLESGTAKKDYDLTTYPKGVYHLRLSTDEGTRVLKVVKN
jgi:hypothetical protein